MFEFSEWSRLWPRQLSEEEGGIRSFFLYSGLFYADNDVSVCSTIQLWSVDASNQPSFRLTKVFFRGFISLILMQGAFSFFFLMNWYARGWRPHESLEKTVYEFFTAYSLNDSANSGESVSSPFSLKISIGLKEFPCTECPHVSFFSSVRSFTFMILFPLCGWATAYPLPLFGFLLVGKKISQHIVKVWTFWICCSFLQYPKH